MKIIVVYKKNFGSYMNYVARNDGSIRLNGEANQFVSNWFESVKIILVL